MASRVHGAPSVIELHGSGRASPRIDARGQTSPDGLSAVEAPARLIVVGFIIPRMPRFVLRVPPAGPLRSAGIAPRRRYVRTQVRRALAFAALRLSACLARLPCFRRFSRRGERTLPCFNPWPCARAVRLLPRRAAPLAVEIGSRLLPSPSRIVRARRSGAHLSFGASTGRSSRRYGPRTRTPRLPGALSVGFARGISPVAGATRASAASTFCRFRTFTLRIHGYLRHHTTTPSALP